MPKKNTARAGLTGALLALAAIPAVPSIASADRADCARTLERTYTRRYIEVRDRHGARAPGRNIRRDGVLYRRVVFDATCGELRRSSRQLRQLLQAPTLMTSRSVPPARPPAGVQTDANVAALPECTWRPESGGSYTAVNPSSGAWGKYQVIPSTWAAHCGDLDRGPSGQETCAARVYAAQGAGAWANC
jgi:hypothetical protein